MKTSEAVKELTSTLDRRKAQEFKKLIQFMKKNDILFTFRTDIGAIDIKSPEANNWRRYYVYKEELSNAGKVSPSKLRKSLKKKIREPVGRLNGMSDDDKKPLNEWKNDERFRNAMDRLGIMDYKDADQEIFDTLSEDDREQLNEELAGGFSGPGTRMEEGEIDIEKGEDNWFVRGKDGKVKEKYSQGQFNSAEEVRDHYKGSQEGGEKSQNEESSTVSKEYEPTTKREMRLSEANHEEISEMIYDAQIEKESDDTLSENAKSIYRNLQESENGVLLVGRSEKAEKALEELKKEGLAFFDEYKDDPNRYAVVTAEDDGMRMQRFFKPLQEGNKHYYEYETKGTDKRDQAGNSKDERLPEGWEEVKSTYGKLSESNEEVTLGMLEEELGRKVTAREYKKLQEMWTADQPTSDEMQDELYGTQKEAKVNFSDIEEADLANMKQEELYEMLNEKEYEAIKGMDKYKKGDGFDNSACINDLEGKKGIDDPAAVCRAAEIAHTGEADPTTKQERQVDARANPDKTRARQHNKRTRKGQPLEEAVRNAIHEALTDDQGNDVDVEPETTRKDMRDWLKERIQYLQENEGDVDELVEEIMQRLNERRFREDVPPDEYRVRRHNKRRRIFKEVKKKINEMIENGDLSKKN